MFLVWRDFLKICCSGKSTWGKQPLLLRRWGQDWYLLGEDMFLETSHHWRPMLRMAEWRNLCLPATVVPPPPCGNNKTAVWNVRLWSLDVILFELPSVNELASESLPFGCSHLHCFFPLRNSYHCRLYLCLYIA